MKPVRIIIFTKAAQAGFTKTRLIPALGKQGAANLAKKMLIHTLSQSLEAGVGPVEMCVTPQPTDSIWQEFAVLGDLEYSDQGTGDLGERLSRVTQRVIDRGESLLIIGTDCTQLTATHLQRAKESLDNFDSILIPATDGGYVLFGLNFFHASLFESIKWSTDTVYAETTERLETLGRTIKIFPSMNDIDEPKDLKFLPSTWREADY